MADYGTEYVKCPFFLKKEEYRIKCEGVEKGNNIHLVFGSSKKIKNYLNDFCCENHSSCRIYKMLEQKYE